MSLLQKLFGRDNTLVIHRVTLKLCTDSRSPYETAAFLERLVYFQGKKVEAGQDPWVYDTRETLTEQLCFAERQLKNAIAYLKDELGVLHTQRRLINYQGSPATVTHYWIDLPLLEVLLLQGKPDPSGSVNPADPEGYETADAVFDETADAYKGAKSPTKTPTKTLSALRSEQTDPVAVDGQTGGERHDDSPTGLKVEGGTVKASGRAALPAGTVMERILAARRAGTTNPPPSFVHGETVVGRVGDDTESATTQGRDLPARPVTVERSSPPSAPAAPAGSRKTAKKPKADKAPVHPLFQEMKEAMRLAAYGDIEISAHGTFGRMVNILLATNLTPDDAQSFVAFLKSIFPFNKDPVLDPVKVTASHVDGWRSVNAGKGGVAKTHRNAGVLSGKLDPSLERTW